MASPHLLKRTVMYEVLRDGSVRELEWDLVQTNLGAMFQPRTLIPESGSVINQDAYDLVNTYTERIQVPPEMFQLTGGRQSLAKYNTQ